MADRCLACTLELSGDADMHPACARELFGRARVPTIDLDPNHLYLFGQEMAGRTTLSGVQSKVSLGWHQKSLRVRAESSAFILKPQSSTYPELPQNEHICMRIARLRGLRVAEHGLVRLTNGSLALIVRRFDRDGSRRIPMEDFGQLAEKLPREKYDGSAELCARIVRRYAAEPVLDQLNLFRVFLCSWWLGNGDLHLKNLALLSVDRERPRLSPAYDLLCTQLVIANDPQALPVAGKKSRLDRADWLTFAEYCEVPRKLAEIEIENQRTTLEPARALVDACFLSEPFRTALMERLEEHTSRLA